MFRGFWFFFFFFSFFGLFGLCSCVPFVILDDGTLEREYQLLTLSLSHANGSEST